MKILSLLYLRKRGAIFVAIIRFNYTLTLKGKHFASDRNIQALKNSSRQKRTWSRWLLQKVLVLFWIRWPPAHDTISFHTYFSHFYVFCVCVCVHVASSLTWNWHLCPIHTQRHTALLLEINQLASQQINTTMEYFNLLQITLFLFLRCVLILFSAFLRWQQLQHDRANTHMTILMKFILMVYKHAIIIIIQRNKKTTKSVFSTVSQSNNNGWREMSQWWK